MLTTRRLATVLAGGALLAVPLAGCGGGSDNNDTSASATTQSTTAGGAGGQTIDVSETDYKLNPSDPTVKAGQVTIKATNDGQTTHSVEIEDVTPGNDEKLPNDLTPGQSGELTVNLKPGTYEWYCPIDGHKGLGMKGEITVQ